MPNHFVTVALGAMDWQRLEAKGLDEVDLSPLNGANLCELAVPTPDVFKSIVAGTTPFRMVHKETGEILQDCNGVAPDDNWKQVNLTSEERDALLRKYGGDTWYGWCNYTWGTKWGTYRTKAELLDGDGSPVLITFCSAWGPPNLATLDAIREYLNEHYCIRNLRFVGHDPYDGDVLVVA